MDNTSMKLVHERLRCYRTIAFFRTIYLVESLKEIITIICINTCPRYERLSYILSLSKIHKNIKLLSISVVFGHNKHFHCIKTGEILTFECRTGVHIILLFSAELAKQSRSRISNLM